MNKKIHNPDLNSLRPDISIEKIKDGIKHSGYPLQVIISNHLENKFLVQQEWAYVDQDTESIRSIDILAELMLYDPQDIKPKVRPSLNLLIECKKSELPCVFFLSKNMIYPSKFPVIAGLPKDEISIITDDDASTFNHSIIQTFSLCDHEFLKGSVKTCATFTKCNRKGTNLELSGSEPFNGIVMPLTKTLNHLKKIETPKKSHCWLDCHSI